MPPSSLLVLLAALAIAVPAQAQDARRGRQLYETHCLSCHYEHVHERARERSKVHSLDDLQKQVKAWGELTGQAFTQEDLDDIVAYLDQSHYRFAK